MPPPPLPRVPRPVASCARWPGAEAGVQEERQAVGESQGMRSHSRRSHQPQRPAQQQTPRRRRRSTLRTSDGHGRLWCLGASRLAGSRSTSGRSRSGWNAMCKNRPRGFSPFALQHAPLAPDQAQGGIQLRPASVLADMFTALFSTQAQGAAARAGGAVEVRRVRGGGQSSASSTEAGDLSPQCQTVFLLPFVSLR